MMINRNLKPIVASLTTGGMLAVALLLLFSANSPKARAAASDLFVTPSGSGDCSQGNPCDLQTALSQAMVDDNLYLAQGTYTGSGGAVITITKSIGLFGGWDGSTTTPVVRDPDTYTTTLDGEDARRVINIEGYIGPTIDGFTIRGGKGLQGGGIYVSGAWSIIQNNVIIDNEAYDDPGEINDGRGGGIYAYGGGFGDHPSIISGNRIYNNSSLYGGGIYHMYTSGNLSITISSNEIISNMAEIRGGGIYIWNTPDIVQSNVISANVAGEEGGGIGLWNSPARVEGNILINNTTPYYGGGISIQSGSTANLINNFLIKNTIDGVFVYKSSPVMVNNTIVARIPNTGSGLLLESASGCAPDDCTMGSYINNIIVKYQYGISGVGLITPTIDYNDVWGSSLNNYSLPVGVMTGTHNISLNPRFASTYLNEYHLLSDSPCIDAGDPAGIPPAPATDLEGQSRPAAGGVDIGADEVWFMQFLPTILRQ